MVRVTWQGVVLGVVIACGWAGAPCRHVAAQQAEPSSTSTEASEQSPPPQRPQGADFFLTSFGVEVSNGAAGVSFGQTWLHLGAGADLRTLDTRHAYFEAGLRLGVLAWCSVDLHHWIDPWVGLGYRWAGPHMGYAEVGIDVALLRTGQHPFVRLGYRREFGQHEDHRLLVAFGYRAHLGVHSGPAEIERLLRRR